MRNILAALLITTACGRPLPAWNDAAATDAGPGYAEPGSGCSVVQENTGSCSVDQRQLLVCSDGGWRVFHECTATFCCDVGGLYGCDAPSATTPYCRDGGPAP